MQNQICLMKKKLCLDSGDDFDWKDKCWITNWIETPFGLLVAEEMATMEQNVISIDFSKFIQLLKFEWPVKFCGDQLYGIEV